MPALIPASRDATSRAAKKSWQSRRYDEVLKNVVEKYTLRIKLCERAKEEKK